MKRWVWLIPTLLWLATPSIAQDWTRIIKATQASIVALEDLRGQNFCTGFVIDAEKHLVLTAGHCITQANGPVRIEGTPTRVVFLDLKSDVAVIVSTSLRPQLWPSTRAATPGLPLISIGFGYGWESAQFRLTSVSIADYAIAGETGTFLGLSTPIIHGQSGGPLVDPDGRVAGMNLLTDAFMGFGRPTADILRLIGHTWRH